MKRQISRISVRQTAKVIGGVYTFLASPILLWGIVRLLSRSANSSSEVSPVWLLVSPFIYGFCAYVLALMTCLGYNIIARYFGGIEFTTIEKNRE
jgi:hypothetical protein